jgi:hypothetical protein
VHANDTRQVSDPPTNQMLTNQTSFNSQDAMGSVQSPLEHRASEYWWPSPATGIENGTPRDFTLYFDEDTIESVQSSPGHCTSESLRDFALDFGEDGHPSFP